MAKKYLNRLFGRFFGSDDTGDTAAVADRSFAARVSEFWNWFGEHSSELKQLLQQKESGFEKIRTLMDEGLAIIGDDVYYNMGGENELTFCVESRSECHYIYPYLVSSMPESLKDGWTVHACKQPATSIDFVFGMYGRKIDISQIMISVDYNKETNSFTLRYYHPELSQLSESESLNAFYIILELVVGEGPVYNYISNVTQAKDAEGMFPIGELRAALKYFVEENGGKYSVEPELLLSSYSCEPEDDESRPRLDIICGTTRFISLLRDYYENSRETYDRLSSKGVEAVMLILTQPADMPDKDFLDFRYKVEDRLQDLFDKSVIKGLLLGGAYAATGKAYIDLLLYDCPQFIDFLGEPGELDRLLSLDNGKVCPTHVELKTFIPDSIPQILR